MANATAGVAQYKDFSNQRSGDKGKEEKMKTANLRKLVKPIFKIGTVTVLVFLLMCVYSLVPGLVTKAFAWDGNITADADCSTAYAHMSTGWDNADIYTIDGISGWDLDRNWQEGETSHQFVGYIHWPTGESWTGTVSVERPICPTDTPPAPTATPTETPPTWKFEWVQDQGCIQPYLRVHNMNSVTVNVTGEIWAEDYLVAQVPEPYQSCPADGWCGPEGDMPANFVGTLSAWVSVKYEGEEVEHNEFSVELNCTVPTETPPPPTPTATPTATVPQPTPTGTLQPTSTEKPIVSTTPVAPNTGAVSESAMPFYIYIGLAGLMIIIASAVVILKRVKVI